MSPLETFFTLGFVSTFAVGLLATWFHFANKPSAVRQRA